MYRCMCICMCFAVIMIALHVILVFIHAINHYFIIACLLLLVDFFHNIIDGVSHYRVM